MFLARGHPPRPISRRGLTKRNPFPEEVVSLNKVVRIINRLALRLSCHWSDAVSSPRSRSAEALPREGVALFVSPCARRRSDVQLGPARLRQLKHIVSDVADSVTASYIMSCACACHAKPIKVTRTGQEICESPQGCAARHRQRCHRASAA